jgi:predicted nucleotidyltransferase
MSGKIQNLMVKLRHGLEALYADRLRGVYLYGSFARGEQESDSDVDVLIILDRIEAYGAEIDRTSELISSLSLQNDLSLSRVFVSEEAWQDARSTFLASVREYAIAA